MEITHGTNLATVVAWIWNVNKVDGPVEKMIVDGWDLVNYEVVAFIFHIFTFQRRELILPKKPK